MFLLEESVGFLANRAAAALRGALERKLVVHGITAQQWAVLLLCGRGETAAPSELSRVLGIDAAAVTRLLDRLEAKELAVRRPSHSDRRALTVELTARSRALLPKLPIAAQGVLDQALMGFSRAEVERLKSALLRILANLARAEPA